MSSQVFHVGTTGRRTPLSCPQRSWLSLLRPLWSQNVVLHQGCCLGSDTEVADAAHSFGARIHSHPASVGSSSRQHGSYRSEVVHEPKWFHNRNRGIVHASSLLIGFPDSLPRKGSGTWHTLDYAGLRGVPVMICWMDGRVCCPPVRLRFLQDM